MHKRMLAGDLYIADDPQLAGDRQRAADLMEAFNRSPLSQVAERRHLLADLLGAYGEGSEIRPPLYCDYGYQTRNRGSNVRELWFSPAG
jgi:maltose O-acetyltransferase